MPSGRQAPTARAVVEAALTIVEGAMARLDLVDGDTDRNPRVRTRGTTATASRTSTRRLTKTATACAQTTVAMSELSLWSQTQSRDLHLR